MIVAQARIDVKGNALTLLRKLDFGLREFDCQVHH
jgi:hypothetical protein